MPQSSASSAGTETELAPGGTSGGVSQALGEPEIAEPVGLLATLASDDDALGTAPIPLGSA
jgi:hypothetical protein